LHCAICSAVPREMDRIEAATATGISGAY